MIMSHLFTVGLHLMFGFHFLVRFLLRLVSNSISGDLVEVVVRAVVVVVAVVEVVVVLVVVAVVVVVDVEVDPAPGFLVVVLGLNLILEGLGNGLLPPKLEWKGRL